MEVVVTAGAIGHAKLQSNYHQQQTNTKSFYRSDALPVAQPTVSKHWREIYHIPWTCLPQIYLGIFQVCLWPLVSPGYIGGGLPCCSSALLCRYPKLNIKLHKISKLHTHLGFNETVLSGVINVHWQSYELKSDTVVDISPIPAKISRPHPISISFNPIPTPYSLATSPSHPIPMKLIPIKAAVLYISAGNLTVYRHHKK